MGKAIEVVAKKIWVCKIGEVPDELLMPGSDYPMREAVRNAYLQLTGQEPKFLFSGWDGSLTELEREVVELHSADALITAEQTKTEGGGDD